MKLLIEKTDDGAFINKFEGKPIDAIEALALFMRNQPVVAKILKGAILVYTEKQKELDEYLDDCDIEISEDTSENEN